MEKSLRKILLLCVLAYACLPICSRAYAQAIAAAHEVTASDYCRFLNDEATSDPDRLYDEKMSSAPEAACILRLGTPGKYFYQVIAGRENFPITYVNKFNQIGYCHWAQSSSFALALASTPISNLLSPISCENSEFSLKCNRINFYIIANNDAPQTLMDPIVPVVAVDGTREIIEDFAAGVSSLLLGGGIGHEMRADDELPQRKEDGKSAEAESSEAKPALTYTESKSARMPASQSTESDSRGALTYADWKRDHDAQQGAIAPAFKERGIYRLKPINIYAELAGLKPSHPLMKLAKKIREKDSARSAALAELYKSDADEDRDSDENWRLLYNPMAKNTARNVSSKYAEANWAKVDSAKRTFKKSYNRARQGMTDFHFAERDTRKSIETRDPNASNLVTIHEQAERLQNALAENLKKIHNAYAILLGDILPPNHELQQTIEDIAGLWNEAAAKAEEAEHFWKMGAGYAKNVRLNNIISVANTETKARYNLGLVTSQEVHFLCESFVGPYFQIASTDGGGRRLVSEDKLKQSRFTEYKTRSEFTGWLGCWMANLQRKLDNGSWTNGHLTVSGTICLVPKGYLDDHYILSSDDESSDDESDL